MAGFIESVAPRHGVPDPLQMTVATTDGQRLWAFRYSSRHDSRSLFVNTAVSALRELYPDNENLRRLSDETRIVVSEPLGELPGAWQPIPESSWGSSRRAATCWVRSGRWNRDRSRTVPGPGVRRLITSEKEYAGPTHPLRSASKVVGRIVGGLHE